MTRFFLTVAALFALLNAWTGHSLLARWPWAQAHAAAFWVTAAAFFLLQIAAPLIGRLIRLPSRGATAAFSTLAYLAFGVFTCLFLYTLAADLGSVLWQLLFPSPDPAAFDHRVLLLVGGVTLATAVLGLWQALSGPVVKRVRVALPGLPPEFEGFRMAQVSDLHVGAGIGRAYAQDVVQRVNALQPNLVALTGDFIDGTVRDLAPEVAPLAALSAPQGVYFVTGNHEYYWNAPAWSAHMRSLGARVLDNEHVVLQRGTARLVVAGVPDYSTRHLPEGQRSDPARALRGAPADTVKILLAHQPASYVEAQAAGFDLQLSGHTHGGQYFPFSQLIRFFQRYYKGLNRHGGLWVYVNRGTGYWGPPLRTGVPAEITLLTLMRG